MKDIDDSENKIIFLCELTKIIYSRLKKEDIKLLDKISNKLEICM